jgi:hypothetical protein
MSTSRNNRKARYYRLIPVGRKQLVAQTARWQQLVHAIGRILNRSQASAMGWRRFFHRTRWDAERARELGSSLQIQTDDSIARGMSPHAGAAAETCRRGTHPPWPLIEVLAAQ